jgi:exosortase
LYGVDAFRAARFPLLFLGFMIPIPGIVLDGATYFLKGGSTEAVAGLFSLTRTPYYREGFTFSLADFVIVVADECSGIRSSIALLLTTLMAGHMFLGRAWTKTVLALAILPVVILKNGIRIASLSLLAMHVDPGFLTGQLHHEGGVVFFLLALAILGPVLFMLRRAEMARTRGVSANQSSLLPPSLNSRPRTPA